jgi:O-acetylserine/cysteine efflux transporter
MRLPHFALAILVTAIWGFNIAVVKASLEEIPPLLLCFLRFFFSSIPAIFFIKRPAVPFRIIVRYGLVMFGLIYALFFTGMHVGVTAGLASVLLQLQVFFTILLGVIFFKEKLHLWQIVGALVAALGIAFIVMNIGDDVTLLGLLLVMGAALSWAGGNVISKKIGRVNMVSLVAWGSLVAWPPFLAMTLFADGPDKIMLVLQNLTWISVAAIFYIAVVATLVAFGIWSWLLHHHPLGAVAPFSLLIPVFAITSSALMLGEPLQAWKLTAALLVTAGLAINFAGPRLFPKNN